MNANGLGPLSGLRVLEFAGIGPAPHACTLLADLGADVVRVRRPGATAESVADPFARGRSAIVELDLKSNDGRLAAIELLAKADILVEGFRPGVMESLGIGPAQAREANPRLIYGRMTGWGQYGPLASAAGHDINYLGVTGLLSAIGPAAGPPAVPLNLIGDFGGGSMFLLLGVLSALYERQRSGLGQVVDAAMVDGAIALSNMIWVMRGLPDARRWIDERESNSLDGGAPYYGVYETADGRYFAVGAIEPQFYSDLIKGLGLDASLLPPQHDRAQWPTLQEEIARAFRSRTRDEWVRTFAELDACATPVLDFAEAPADPHLAARESFANIAGVVQHAPAPRFSRSAPQIPGPAPDQVTETQEIWRRAWPDLATVSSPAMAHGQLGSVEEEEKKT